MVRMEEGWQAMLGNSVCGAMKLVDVWYPPAGTAPVRLLVEAEASPAFLRRARVWAQGTACTKQAGGKAKTVRSRRTGEKRVRGGRKTTEKKESVRAGRSTNRAARHREPSSQAVSSHVRHGQTSARITTQHTHTHTVEWSLSRQPDFETVSTGLEKVLTFWQRRSHKLLESQRNPELHLGLSQRLKSGLIHPQQISHWKN